MNEPPKIEELERLYASHPLREDTILERIRRYAPTLRGLTEIDLAFDPIGEITDQNHLGGMASVIALAVALRIAPEVRVVDFGAGLGGPCRLLAMLYGVHATGIEITRTRCEQARRLTALVGLGDRVTMHCGDVRDVAALTARFDLAISQNAMSHLGDPVGACRAMATVLVPGGRVALEEVVLVETARGDARVTALERIWASSLPTVRHWSEGLAAAGLAQEAASDLSLMAAHWFGRLQAAADRGESGRVSTDERDGWRLARELLAEGLLGFRRFIARRPVG